jgi:hypothetical protein
MRQTQPPDAMLTIVLTQKAAGPTNTFTRVVTGGGGVDIAHHAHPQGMTMGISNCMQILHHNC